MLLRRSATLLSRLGPQLAAAAAESGGPAWAPQSAAALQLLGHTQHWDGGGSEHRGRQGGAWQPAQHTVRHLSLWPGGGKKRADEQQQQQQQPDTAAVGEDFGASDTAAAAATSLDASSSGSALAAAAADSGGGGLAAAAGAPGVADLFTASAIIAAAAGAEADALAAAREDSWIVTRGVQSLLVGLHGALGLEWWQSIMAATCAMRLATLPLMLAQVKNTYRMSQARPEMEELMRYFKEDQARGNTEAALEHQQRILAVWKKYDCNPLKSLMGIFVQAPIFIGFFSALRGFAAHKVPSMTEGGALWFTDLTVADPTYLLPALAGATFLLTVELGAADGMQGQPAEMQKKMKTVMRLLALVVPLLSATLPSSVFMYWTASNMFSLLQTSVLKLPVVKRLVGLPNLAAAAGQAPQQKELVGKPVQTFATRPPRKPRKEAA